MATHSKTSQSLPASKSPTLATADRLYQTALYLGEARVAQERLEEHLHKSANLPADALREAAMLLRAMAPLIDADDFGPETVQAVADDLRREIRARLKV